MEKKQVNFMQLQSSEICKFLEVNENDENCIWKVLIFDQFCQNILSTLFKVGDFRDKNIALHLNLNSQREVIQGAKAIYFIQPTQENIQRIIEDFGNKLYDQVFINFSFKIEKNIFENFAIQLGKLGQAHKVKKVLQHQINFVSLTNNLFSLNINNAYEYSFQPKSGQQQQQNDNNNSQQNSKQQQIQSDQKIHKNIVQSLFSVCRIAQIFPKIVYKNSNKIIQRIVEDLGVLFNEQVQQENAQLLTLNQPVMLIVDRNIDLGSVVMHPLLYGGLIHDILGIENNKVNMQNQLTDQKLKIYDLDPQMDRYWEENINSPFYIVAEQSVKEIESWEAQYNSMSHNKQQTDTSLMAQNIQESLDMVTDMTEKKKRIDMHTNLSSHIMNEIKQRHLDQYYELGNTLIFKNSLLQKEYSELKLLLENKDSLEIDKLRILIIYLLYSNPEPKKFSELVTIANIKDQNYIKVLQGLKQQQPNQSEQQQENQTESNQNQKQIIPSFFKDIAYQVGQQVKSKGKDIISNVANYIPKSEQRFPLVNLVQELIENRGTVLQNNGYSFFDPVQGRDAQINRNFNDVYVFVLEGSCYNEYAGLCDLAKKLNKNIFYGGCNILNGEQLINSMIKVLDESK